MKRKQIALILLLLFMSFLIISGVAFAADYTGQVLSKGEAFKNSFVKFIQDAAKLFATIFIAWYGISVWQSGGDPQRKAAAKDKLLFFFIAMFLVFGAEDIGNAIWGFFQGN